MVRFMHLVVQSGIDNRANIMSCEGESCEYAGRYRVKIMAILQKHVGSLCRTTGDEILIMATELCVNCNTDRHVKSSRCIRVKLMPIS